MCYQGFITFGTHLPYWFFSLYLLFPTQLSSEKTSYLSITREIGHFSARVIVSLTDTSNCQTHGITGPVPRVTSLPLPYKPVVRSRASEVNGSVCQLADWHNSLYHSSFFISTDIVSERWIKYLINNTSFTTYPHGHCQWRMEACYCNMTDIQDVSFLYWQLAWQTVKFVYFSWACQWQVEGISFIMVCRTSQTRSEKLRLSV